MALTKKVNEKDLRVLSRAIRGANAVRKTSKNAPAPWCNYYGKKDTNKMGIGLLVSSLAALDRSILSIDSVFYGGMTAITRRSISHLGLITGSLVNLDIINPKIEFKGFGKIMSIEQLGSSARLEIKVCYLSDQQEKAWRAACDALASPVLTEKS